jgi:hypothetical protein
LMKPWLPEWFNGRILMNYEFKCGKCGERGYKTRQETETTGTCQSIPDRNLQDP